MEKIIEDIVPTKFELAQSYPNPFSDKTTIKFCIPDRMKIKLAIYNSDNRKVKTLIDEIKEAGTYEVEFKANGLDSGKYFYKLESTEYSDTKNMIVLK
jgi:hypothetical protein